jgi:hypothetical protein
LQRGSERPAVYERVRFRFFFFFRVFILLSTVFPQFSLPLCLSLFFFPLFHCSIIFIGEVWLDHNHIGPSTLFFLILIFSYFFYIF